MLPFLSDEMLITKIFFSVEKWLFTKTFFGQKSAAAAASPAARWGSSTTSGPKTCFAKSEHIMLVLPLAPQLTIHFLFRKISSAAPPWGTWLRTHCWGIEREEPRRNQSHDLKSFVPQACALPLCHNHYPNGPTELNLDDHFTWHWSGLFENLMHLVKFNMARLK